MEPIANLLSGTKLAMAMLQDTLIDLIYDTIQSDAMLYGGTAVWRCYDGNRFSEDIDIYMKEKAIEALAGSLVAHGLRLLWRSEELPGNMRIGNGMATVLLEAKEGSGESLMRQYTRTDGSFAAISVLSPTEMLVRKIEAYNGRGFARDIYDIFVLTRFLDRHDYTVATELERFLKEIKKPSDEKVLQSLIYAGDGHISYATMIDYIDRWLHEI